MDNNYDIVPKRKFTPLAFILLALVVTAVVTLLIYFWPSSKPASPSKSHPQTSSNSNNSPKGASSGNSNSNSGAGSNSGSSPSSNSNPTPPTSGTTSGSGASSSGSSSSLANTGPGDVVALSAGVAALGALGHALISRQKARRSNN